MDAAQVIQYQRENLESAVTRYQELIEHLSEGERPEEACFFFDQCIIGRIAEAVVSAFDTGYIAELEERIACLEQQLELVTK